MFAVVLIALTLSLLIMFVVVVFAFLDVAFGPQRVYDGGRIKQDWQPPLIHDDELFAWAADVARSNVRRRLPHQGGVKTARNIATDIYAGTTYAIESAPHKPKRDSEHDCSSCRHQMIAVTPPEALAVVETICTKHPGDVNRIRNQAIENAKRVADMDLTQYQAAKIVCPLLCDGNTCAANGMRPIHCRGWFPLPDRQNEVGSSSEDAGTIDAHAHTVGQGAENGLASELDERGLDGNRYELNSALAVAFDTPNAAELWANGEPVFERCKPHDTIRAT